MVPKMQRKSSCASEAYEACKLCVPAQAAPPTCQLCVPQCERYERLPQVVVPLQEGRGVAPNRAAHQNVMAGGGTRAEQQCQRARQGNRAASWCTGL